MNLSKISIFVAALFASILSFSSSSLAAPEWYSSRAVPPIVSPNWLLENKARPNLVILDVRPAQSYASGHIPNAINAPFQVPFSAWITMKDDLLLEIPPKEELFSSLGGLGILPSSWVVVVSAPNEGEPASYGFSAATRVADTLIYAGVPNVSVLDGGYPNWVRAAGTTTTAVPTVTATTYVGRVRDNLFVSTEYVKEHLGRSLLIDARDAEVYFGASVEPFANLPGHIPSAKSLPTPWLWSSDGIYKDTAVLRKMAFGVTGWSGAREIIVYCGVGGYASSAWYVLTQVLGYPNVKFYDGSAQLWAKTEVMVPYRWE